MDVHLLAILHVTADVIIDAKEVVRLGVLLNVPVHQQQQDLLARAVVMCAMDVPDFAKAIAPVHVKVLRTKVIENDTGE